MQQEIANAIAALETNLNIVTAEKHSLPYTFKMQVEYGKVYARIVRGEVWENNPDEVVNRSCFGFIKLDDGTLWKSAGWKAPAKNKPRGELADLHNIENIRRKWQYSIS